MHAVRKLSVWYKIPIWSNSLTLTNASELFWTISKFMRREWILLLLVYVLHKTWNLVFSRVVVQLTAKKCTKKRDARAKLLFCLIKLLLIWLSRRRRILNFLLFTIHCDPAGTEFSQGIKNELFLLIASETFFDLSVVPSFLLRKVENKSFPCSHKLGERTGQLWQDNSRRVLTHEKIGHNNTKHFFVPNQEPPSAWIFGTS